MKVHRINIIQDDNGFTIQGANQQIPATDEQGVQEAVKTIVTAICNPTPKPERTTPTVKHFRDGKEVSEEEALSKPLRSK